MERIYFHAIRNGVTYNISIVKTFNDQWRVYVFDDKTRQYRNWIQTRGVRFTSQVEAELFLENLKYNLIFQAEGKRSQEDIGIARSTIQPISQQ